MALHAYTYNINFSLVVPAQNKTSLVVHIRVITSPYQHQEGELNNMKKKKRPYLTTCSLHVRKNYLFLAPPACSPLSSSPSPSHRWHRQEPPNIYSLSRIRTTPCGGRRRTGSRACWRAYRRWRPASEPCLLRIRHQYRKNVAVHVGGLIEAADDIWSRDGELQSAHKRVGKICSPVYNKLFLSLSSEIVGHKVSTRSFPRISRLREVLARSFPRSSRLRELACIVCARLLRS